MFRHKCGALMNSLQEGETASCIDKERFYPNAATNWIRKEQIVNAALLHEFRLPNYMHSHVSRL
jgi:hypothetical protein